MTLKEATAIMDSLPSSRSHSIEVIMEAGGIVYRHWENSDWDYRTVGEWLIALEFALDSEEKAIARLRSNGISLSMLRNGKPLYLVHEYYVRGLGAKRWAWFKSLNYPQVRLLIKATNKHNRFKLRKEPIFDGSAAAWRRIQELAE